MNISGTTTGQPSIIKYHEQKKIGGTFVSNDPKGKVGSVRGTQYSTLDAFGRAGQAPLMTVTDAVQKFVEPTFRDITSVVNKEFPLEKPPPGVLPLETFNKIGEPFSQFGRVLRGINVPELVVAGVPGVSIPTLRKTQNQGKKQFSTTNPFSEESVFSDLIPVNQVDTQPELKIETKGDEIPPTDNDFLAIALARRQKRIQPEVRIDLDQFANPADIKNAVLKSGGKSLSKAVASTFGSSNITERELNREHALGSSGRRSRVLQDKIDTSGRGELTTNGFTSSGSSRSVFLDVNKALPPLPSPELRERAFNIIYGSPTSPETSELRERAFNTRFPEVPSTPLNFKKTVLSPISE